MFIHNKCGSNLLIDITSAVNLLVSVGINKDGIKPNQGNFVFKKEEFELEFYCFHCKEETSMDEILVICMYCGTPFNLGKSTKELFTLHKSGGIYCGSCCEKYYADENKTPLSKCLNKIRM